MSGIFLTFEGGDGSGKSTHARLVAQRLQEEGHDVVFTREPGDTPPGKTIREVIIAHELAPRAELLLFLADRSQHVEDVVKPALAEGKIVICDRFSGSTFAYQLGGRELGQEKLVAAMDAFARDGVEPDHTIYLDIEPKEAMKRRKEDAQQESDRFDQEEVDFHTRVRESFLKQAEAQQWVTIDTAGTQKENHEKIYSAVKALV
jgi:dTMP kinase